MDGEVKDWPAEAVQAIQVPVLLIIGDSDIIRPEHAVEMFRLLGGGVAGDVAGLPHSQLAVLPGTTHVTLADRADWLVSMIEAFLDMERGDLKWAGRTTPRGRIREPRRERPAGWPRA